MCASFVLSACNIDTHNKCMLIFEFAHCYHQLEVLHVHPWLQHVGG